MDRKYRETVPEMLKTLLHAPASDDDSPKKLRRKPPKPGKNGLFPGEEAVIKTWWLRRDRSLADMEASETQMNLINGLKTRETQLQIVLVLEVLALESIAVKVESSPEIPKKKKKDLNILLDLLVDRLGIWQSTNAENLHLKRLQESEESVSIQQFIADVVLPL